jgi:formylglycine-generating enzyme required for sulfatase activity
MLAQTGQAVCNGKYEILRLIGEGGQSRVWLAREVKRGLEVAIKEPLPVLSSREREELEERFQRELKLSARIFQLDVPNTVRVLTVEEHEGQTLLVMEYCAGGSLAERLQRGPLPVDEALRITLELCGALEVVHSKLRLVHRDIKPSNILFTADGHAKLGDFGLAQTGESSRSPFVSAGHPGTPGYMSPEQERQTGYLTPASDLYSLGCVLFEMVTRQQYQLQRPGTLASSLRPETPAWVDVVLAKVLQQDLWQRCETACEVARAIARQGRALRDEQRLEDRRALGETGLDRPTTLPSAAVAPPGQAPAAEPAAGTTRVLEKAGIVLMYVQGGEYLMGSGDSDTLAETDEKPQHRVYLDGYWIGQTEVTNAQYRKFIQAGGYSKRDYWTDDGWSWKEDLHVAAPGHWEDAEWNQPGFPVVGVSWYEAAVYAKWAGARLPTEAEWESAARGGPKGLGYLYAGGNDPGEVAWYDDNSGQRTHPVGQKKPNELGVYDMSGNALEWCEDWYGNEYYHWSPSENPQGPVSGACRVARGGFWSCNWRSLRCASRVRLNPGIRSLVGFRVAG